MIEFHIDLEPFAGKEGEFESVFYDAFVPAISVQKGYRSIVLLKAREALRRYHIEFTFDSEDLRLQWVASREHQEAFPRLAALCQQITWSGFDVVR